MAIEWHNWAWNFPTKSRTTRLVLLALADRADRDLGIARPGHEELAKRSLSKFRAVQLSLEELILAGAVVRIRRGYVRKSDGQGMAALYLLRGDRSDSEFAEAHRRAIDRYGAPKKSATHCALSAGRNAQPIAHSAAHSGQVPPENAQCAGENAQRRPDNAQRHEQNAQRTSENAQPIAPQPFLNNRSNTTSSSATILNQPAASPFFSEATHAAAEKKRPEDGLPDQPAPLAEDDPEPAVSEDSRNALAEADAELSAAKTGRGFDATRRALRARDVLVRDRPDLQAHADWKFRQKQREQQQESAARAAAFDDMQARIATDRDEALQILGRLPDSADLAAFVPVMSAAHVAKFLAICREAMQRNGTIKNPIGWIRRRARDVGISM